MPPAARSWWMLDVSMCPSSVPSAGEKSLCLGLPLHLPFYVRMEVPPHTASPGSAFPCCQPPKPIPISLCQAVDRMCPIISTRSQPTPSRAAATKVPPRLRATPCPCNLMSVFRMFSPLVPCVVCKVNAPALINMCS